MGIRRARVPKPAESMVAKEEIWHIFAAFQGFSRQLLRDQLKVKFMGIFSFGHEAPKLEGSRQGQGNFVEFNNVVPEVSRRPKARVICDYKAIGSAL